MDRTKKSWALIRDQEHVMYKTDYKHTLTHLFLVELEFVCKCTVIYIFNYFIAFIVCIDQLCNCECYL